MTTPTSGAADLPEALRSIQRFEVVDCIDEKHVPAVIPNPHGPWVRYEDHIAALAAGQATAAQPVVPAEWPTNEMIDAGRKAAASQGRLLGSGQSLWHVFRAMLAAAPAQPAAQQGVAYAALPDEGEPWRGHKFKEVQLGCWRCDCGKTIKEVTSDQSTPASGGNYPVMPKRYTVDDDGEELFTAEKMRAFADATHTLRASHGQAPAQPDQPIACSYGDNGYACCEGGPCQADVHNDKLAEQQAPAGAQADSVQEDAARYRWLRERSSTMFVNVSINGDGAEIAETLDSAVDAARKQGEKQ